MIECCFICMGTDFDPRTMTSKRCADHPVDDRGSEDLLVGGRFEVNGNVREAKGVVTGPADLYERYSRRQNRRNRTKKKGEGTWRQ